jgi:hypothetical protein
MSEQQTRPATAVDVARTQMACSIEDGWQPTNWDIAEKDLPNAVAAAIVAEMRARVIGLKDDAEQSHADFGKEAVRQATFNEVLDLLTAYSHPSEADTYGVRDALR